MTLNPTNPVLLQDDTSAPRFIAAANGVVSAGGLESVLAAGEPVNALELVTEGGVVTGEALSSAATQNFPLGTVTNGGAMRFAESPLLGEQTGTNESPTFLGKGVTPVVPDVATPNAHETRGPVIGTDAQNPVVTALSTAEETIPNTAATRANLTAGQNSPIAGTGGTTRNLGVAIVVTEPGSRAAIL